MATEKYAFEYFDDPIESSEGKSPKTQAIIFLIAACVALFGLRGVYAANISLNLGNRIEFGQGITTTVACSGNTAISIKPTSSFVNATGAGSYYLSGFIVSNIPSGCSGAKLSFSFYTDTGTAPLAIYNSTSTSADVTDTGSSFTSSNSGLSLSDVTSSSFTVTFTSPVQLSTSISKVTAQSSPDPTYSTLGSIQLNSGDAISMATPASVGTGAFTIEGWFKFSSAPSSNALLVYGSYGPGLYINSSMNQIHIVQWGPGTGDQAFYMSALSTNTWYHLAVVRDSSKRTQLFINGAKSTNSYITDNNNYTSGIRAIFGTGAGGAASGYVSNIRMTNTAVYDATASTITKPTAPLTAVSGTLVLLNTQTNAPYADSSGNSITITTSGSPTSSSQNPF